MSHQVLRASIRCSVPLGRVSEKPSAECLCVSSIFPTAAYVTSDNKHSIEHTCQMFRHCKAHKTKNHNDKQKSTCASIFFIYVLYWPGIRSLMAVGECNILTSAQFSNICLLGASINVCLNPIGLRSLHTDSEVRLINWALFHRTFFFKNVLRSVGMVNFISNFSWILFRPTA